MAWWDLSSMFRPSVIADRQSEKAPTIGPATLAKFDGVQLLLLARITRAKRDDGGVPANWFSESQFFGDVEHESD